MFIVSVLLLLGLYTLSQLLSFCLGLFGAFFLIVYCLFFISYFRLPFRIFWGLFQSFAFFSVANVATINDSTKYFLVFLCGKQKFFQSFYKSKAEIPILFKFYQQTTGGVDNFSQLTII